MSLWILPPAAGWAELPRGCGGTGRGTGCQGNPGSDEPEDGAGHAYQGRSVYFYAVMQHECQSMHPPCNIWNACYICALNTCTTTDNLLLVISFKLKY